MNLSTTPGRVDFVHARRLVKCKIRIKEMLGSAAAREAMKEADVMIMRPTFSVGGL